MWAHGETNCELIPVLARDSHSEEKDIPATWDINHINDSLQVLLTLLIALIIAFIKPTLWNFSTAVIYNKKK